MPALLGLVVLVVDEHLESKRVILVSTHREAIVRNQEAVVPESIRIEKLVALLIVGIVSRVHREIYSFFVDVPPCLKVLL